jgi:small conductance mechanosensitive channel
VAYDEHPDRVLAILREVVEEVFAEERWQTSLLEVPTVAGVESVTGGTMTVRIFAKTRPGEQYAVPREVRERAIRAFEQAGVRGPVVAPFQGPQV